MLCLPTCRIKEPSSRGAPPPRPKVLKKIRQQRLSSREHLRCLCHLLSILDVEVTEPSQPLRPADLSANEKRFFYQGQAYLWSADTGSSVWDSVQPAAQRELRLILQPDEGGPMFCAVQWMQSKNFRVLLLRDEV
eukprot:s13_g8.t1